MLCQRIQCARSILLIYLGKEYGAENSFISCCESFGSPHQRETGVEKRRGRFLSLSKLDEGGGGPSAYLLNSGYQSLNHGRSVQPHLMSRTAHLLDPGVCSTIQTDTHSYPCIGVRLSFKSHPILPLTLHSPHPIQQPHRIPIPPCPPSPAQQQTRPLPMPRQS
jgi:hypothetical protein